MTTFSRVHELAKREAERTGRIIAIIQDERGTYDLVFADEYPDDPDIIAWVGRKADYNHYLNEEVHGTAAGTVMDDMIEDLRRIFGENGFSPVNQTMH